MTSLGEVYSWGFGQRGRLGHGDERTRWRPGLIAALASVRVRSVSAGELHSCVLTEDGVVYSFGDCTLGQTGVKSVHAILTPTPVEGLSGAAIAELAVGDHHTLVRKHGGNELLAFGKNLEGQLGVGASAIAMGMAASAPLNPLNPLDFHSLAHSVSTPSRVLWPTSTPQIDERLAAYADEIGAEADQVASAAVAAVAALMAPPPPPPILF